MNAGVSNTPCRVEILPVRAAPSMAETQNSSGGFGMGKIDKNAGPPARHAPH
jgi:hypothetical protein